MRMSVKAMIDTMQHAKELKREAQAIEREVERRRAELERELRPAEKRAFRLHEKCAMVHGLVLLDGVPVWAQWNIPDLPYTQDVLLKRDGSLKFPKRWNILRLGSVLGLRRFERRANVGPYSDSYRMMIPEWDYYQFQDEGQAGFDRALKAALDWVIRAKKPPHDTGFFPVEDAK